MLSYSSQLICWVIETDSGGLGLYESVIGLWINSAEWPVWSIYSSERFTSSSVGLWARFHSRSNLLHLPVKVERISHESLVILFDVCEMERVKFVQKWKYTSIPFDFFMIQVIRYNSLIIARQNVLVTSVLSNFILDLWKDFCVGLSLIDSKETIWKNSFGVPKNYNSYCYIWVKFYWITITLLSHNGYF